MTSTYLTFDLDMTLRFNVYKPAHVQILSLYYLITEVRLFSMIEGKLQKDEINNFQIN